MLLRALTNNCYRIVRSFHSQASEGLSNKARSVVLGGGVFQASRFAFRPLGSPLPWSRIPVATALAGDSGAASGLLSSLGNNFSTFLPSITGAGALAGFQEMGIGGWLLVDLALNWGGWALATALKTETFYDLIGTSSFGVLAIGSLMTAAVKAPRKILVSCMVGVWAARLGSYLVARVHKVGKDSRFDEVKHQPGTFFIYWTMQAMWVFVTVMPVLIINTSPVSVPLKWVDVGGAILWAIGMTFEVVADAQKDAWRNVPENKGKFINTGLWSISRHPNYFGEMMIWWGMFFTCVGGFSKPLHYAAATSPVFVMLLLRYVSGVPILERQADARWGGQPEYEAYKADTPILVPDVVKMLGGGNKASP